MAILLVQADQPGFPECLRPFEKVKGVVIGGCIRETFGGSYPNEFPDTDEFAYAQTMGDIAHCHSYPDTNNEYGFICSRFNILNDKETLLHEAAHIISPPKTAGVYHDKEWAKALSKIGGTLKSYPIDYFGFGFGTNDYSHLIPKQSILHWLKQLLSTLTRTRRNTNKERDKDNGY
jgi:hypothetical protein